MLAHKLTIIFNQSLETQILLEGWKKADIILIYKKEDKRKVENYRPITSGIIFAKIFSKLIETRIQQTLSYQQPREQAGFKSYSTINHLHSINQITEKSKEYQYSIYTAFLAYTKAFDCLKHESLFKALKNQGIPRIMIYIIKNMYNGVRARIIADQMGDYFNIKRGG